MGCSLVGLSCYEYWLYDLFYLTLLHSERPKLPTILAFLSAIGLNLYSYA